MLPIDYMIRLVFKVPYFLPCLEFMARCIASYIPVISISTLSLDKRQTIISVIVNSHEAQDAARSGLKFPCIRLQSNHDLLSDHITHT